MLNRRSLITGLISLCAAPAIVRAESLMKLAPTEIIKPDIKYDLEAFLNQIIEPYLEKYQEAFANAILYGESTILRIGDGKFIVEPANVAYEGGLAGLLDGR